MTSRLGTGKPLFFFTVYTLLTQMYHAVQSRVNVKRFIWFVRRLLCFFCNCRTCADVKTKCKVLFSGMQTPVIHPAFFRSLRKIIGTNYCTLYFLSLFGSNIIRKQNIQTTSVRFMFLCISVLVVGKF